MSWPFLKLKEMTRTIRQYITVEPAVFLTMAGYITFVALKTSIIYYKICSINYSGDPSVDCHHLKATPKAQDAVQEEASLWILYYTIAYVVSSSPMILIWCTWGDNHDLKTVLFLPILGSTLECFLFIVTTVYAMSPLWIIPAGACAAGLTGMSGLVMAVSPQFVIHKEYNKEWVTIRLAILHVVLGVGHICGTYLTSILLEFGKFQYVLLAGQIILVIAAVVLALFVKPLDKRDGEKVLTKTASHPPVLVQLKRLFTEVLFTLTRRRQGRRRSYLLIGMFIYLVIWIANEEIDPIFNIFIMRRPISFTTQKFTIISGVSRVCHLAGTLMGVFVIKRFLHFPDTILVMFGLLSWIARLLSIGLSTTQWSIWMSCGLSTFSMLFVPGMQAFLVDQVENHEKGYVLTAMGVVTNVSNVLSSVMYNNIYHATEKTFAGLTFLIAAGVLCFTLIMIVCIQVDSYIVSRRAGEGVTPPYVDDDVKL